MYLVKHATHWSVSLMVTAVLAGSAATAAPLHPDSIDVFLGQDTRDSTSPYRDDVYLEELVFDGIEYGYGENIVSITQFEVLSGRSKINAEWGDLDDFADGDGNPFAKAGFDPLLQETTDPTIQDLTLLNTFNSGSLSEMSDGEGGGRFSFRVLFAQSLTDNAFGADDRPEIVIFERGQNDRFDVRLLTGGTFDDPELSDWLQIDSREFADTGVFVDTVEIASAQEIGVGGFDLDQFGLAQGARVFGLEMRTRDGSGPDLNGMFLTADDSARFGPTMTPVPVTHSGLLLGFSVAAFLGSLAAKGSRGTSRLATSPFAKQRQD